MSTNKRPLIGITSMALRENECTELSLGLWKDCLFRDYTQSVVAAGGIPVGIPILEDKDLIADLLDRMDGVILTGGPDIYPYLYGQEMQPGMGNSDQLSDQMEIEIARKTFDNKQPTLGICHDLDAPADTQGWLLIFKSFSGDLDFHLIG